MSVKGCIQYFTEGVFWPDRSTKEVEDTPVFLGSPLQHASNRNGHGCIPPQSEDGMRMRQKGPLVPLSCQSWGRNVSPSSLHSFLKEIQASNTAFPVHSVFGTLQRKATDMLQDDKLTGENHFHSRCQHSDKKRKQELGSCETGPKRLRSSNVTATANWLSMETTQPRVSKLSRTRKLKQQAAGENGTSHTEISKTCDVIQKDSSCDDVLWTDKYSPQCASELIGNSLQVNKLHSWLKKWKQRADCDERRPAEQIKPNKKGGGDVSTQDSWDCGDFQGEVGSAEHAEKPPLCNTMLITGPSGVGKTASVYACAQELGFKVFEVNSSSQRCGRQILCQLKEVTQSHLVETAGKDPLKPAYFNNYSTRRSCSPKSETLVEKMSAPKKVTLGSKTRSAQKRGRLRTAGKESPAAVTLTNYFKMKARADHLCGPSLSEKRDKIPSGSDQTAQENKKGAMSLILFEEVDVVFEDDVGFLAAIKTFMTTTKRPVVLTTNDPTFRERFSSSLEEVVFRTPSAVNVCSYLQLVCLAEGVKMELDDVRCLHTLTSGDVRRCLLQLQLWVNSVKGLPEEHLRTHIEGEQCFSHSAGCTASMLGLHPVGHVLNPLKDSSWTEVDMNKLAESWRRNVPLLYSNLELLLPIKAVQGTAVPSAPDTKPMRNGPRLSNRIVEGSSLTHRAQRNSSILKAKSHHISQQTAAKVEFQTLNSLADFFDLMSYLDNTTAAAAPHTKEFVWTGSDRKDGLLDEMSEVEERGSQSQERLLEIRSAVEGLGCRRCLTEAGTCRWEQGDMRWSLTYQPLCDPIVSQRRYRLSRAVLNSRSFSLLGNRQAVCVDYMPAIRSISRSLRQQDGEPARCVNYLYNLHLCLCKTTLRLLAEDFSSISLAI
ncbi:ATPase family AAA domain-containing protein 5b [Dunckerocampus dactyliophorus]|uniref:ATPase family AAA domain-containing protein 5b n=1 Tax=Dunckerocampus dactyliophorus TaxID=161453 RepID=UPI0024070596|nr:ATPase family AAA domain-containing protein 5b [Dunckerocampus dactyliophorus]